MPEVNERLAASLAPDRSAPLARMDFEERSVRMFRSLGWDTSFPLGLGRMAGFDSPESHRFRREAMDRAEDGRRPAMLAAVARGLAGCPSDEAHTLRQELRALGAPVPDLHAGLVGGDGAPHHALRRQLIEADPLLDDSGCLQGLVGCGSAEAVAFRRSALERHGLLEAPIAASLFGCDGDAAHALRRDLRRISERMPDERRRTLHAGILSGLGGCVSPPSIELRWTLFAENADYAAVARSCVGAWSPGLRELWECAASHAPGIVAELLVGIDAPDAHAFRQGLFRRGCDPAALLRGLAGCDGADAWSMRREIVSALPGHGHAALSPSIARCRSEAAWELRTRMAASGAPRLVLLESIVGDGEPSSWLQEPPA